MAKKDTQWILTARDKVSGVLGKVNKSLQETAAQNKKAAQSAEKAAEGIAELDNELGSLNSSLKQTKAASTAAKSLNNLQSEATNLEKRLTAARKAEQEATKALKEASAPAENAQKQLKARISLQRSLETRLIKAKDVQENINAALEVGTITQKQHADQTKNAEKKISDLTARLQNQTKAVKESEASVEKSSKGLDELKGKQQQAAEQAKKLGREQNAMAQQVSKAKAALAAAGVETNDLKEAEAKLERQQKELTEQVIKTKTAIKKMGDESQRTENKMQGLFRASRSSMSVYQRMRGQILSMAAAYVGVYGAVEQIRGVINTTRELEATNARFRVAFNGDQKQVRQEMEYTRRIADELGQDFLKQAKAYSNLAIATKGSAVAGDNTRYVFTAVSAALRATRASATQVEGVFYALTQIFNKGQVTTEDFVQQMGDHMPGALETLAAAVRKHTGDTSIGTAELKKMMEQGELTSDAMVLFAEELVERFGKEAVNATESLEAKMARLGNTWRDIQTEFASSGFLDEFIVALDQLNAALQSEEGKQGARELGRLVASLIKGFAWLIQNIEYLKIGLQALAGSLALKWAIQLMGVIRGIGDFAIYAGRQIKGLAARLIGFFAKGTAKAAIFKTGIWRIFAFLFGPVGIIASLLAAAGSLIASWLYDQSSEFRAWFFDLRIMWDQFAVDAKLALDKAGAHIGAWIKTWGKEYVNFLARIYTNPFDIRGEGKEFVVFEGVGEELKKELERLEKIANDEKNRIARSLIARRDKEESDRLRESGADSESAGESDSEGNSVLNGTVNKDGLKFFSTSEGKEGESQLKKLQDELSRVREKLADIAIESSTGTEKLRLQMAAVEREYQTLLEGSRKVFGINSEQVKLVEQLIAAEKRQLEIAHEKQTLANAEQRVNELLEHRRTLMERIEFLQGQGDYTAANGIKENLEDVNEELSFAIDQAIALAKALGNDALVVQLENVKGRLIDVNEQVANAADLNKELSSGLSDVFLAGAKGFSSMKEAFLNFAGTFLAKIAEMIAQKAIFNALENSGFGGEEGGIGGAIAGAVNSLFLHSGGVAGSGSGRNGNVFAAAFAGAQRFHDGGLPGLKSNEVPAILEKGEEVITRNDPRHILNGSGNGQSGGVTEFTVNNYLDPDEAAGAILGTSTAKKQFDNYIKANRRSVKAILEG